MSSLPSRLLGARSRLALLTVCLAACERAPATELCPRIEAGELVFSELRGEQSSDDSFGHYIELYNASDRTLDLQGVRVRQLALDGDEESFLIRERVELEAGGYAVIGPGLEELPAWIDYGVGWDISGGNVEADEHPRELIKAKFPTGFFQVEACDELIDELFYPAEGIPKSGTLGCGNADAPPSAAANDEATAGSGCWCVDAEPSDPNFPMPGLGLPGSPGRANRCP